MQPRATSHPIRRSLDLVYNVSGGIAAVFLVAILVIIVAQMVARWTGFSLPGSTSYAGYGMAAASFFALAYTLNHGAHIRVSLFINKLGRFRRLGEIWCFGIGAALATYFTFFATKAAYWSYKFNDVSQGQDATPLWIPQLAMVLGAAVFAITLIDHFVRIVFFGLHAIGDAAAADDAETQL